MPPLPVVPGVVKLEFSGTIHDTPWLNIFYVAYSGSAPSSSNLLAYITAIQPAVSNFFADEMHVDNHLTHIHATDLASITGAVADLAFNTPGTRTGEFNPTSVAVCMSLEIARRYRGGHPRKYFVIGTPGTFAASSAKFWDTGFLNDCATNMTLMLAAMIGITEGGTSFNQNVNVSYRSGGVVRAVPVVDPVLSFIFRERVCSQRRRLGKVGG